MAEFLTKKEGKDYLVTDTPENRQKAMDKGLPVYDKLLDYEGKEKWVSQNLSAQAIREKGYRTPEGFLGEQETLKGLREKTPYSPLTTGLESAAGSMSYGLGNLASGAVDYASDVMRGRPASLKQSLAARELQSQIASSAFPKSSIAGSIAGGFIGPGVGGVLSAGSKLGAAGKIAQGAGIGALEGALSTAPEYISNPLNKTTKELAEQTAYGTGFGLLGGTAGGAISARADIAQGLKGMKQRGTEGLENLLTKKEKSAGKVSETLSPEDLTAKDLADIAGSETDVPKPTGWKALLPEQVGKYISNLEQWAVRKQGISKTKQQLADIQKIIKEDKKVFLSEIQDELEKRLFNGKTLDDLSADEIASLEPNLIISVQEQLAKIEKDINQFTSQDYVTTRLRMPSAEASPLQKYVAEMSVGGEGGYGEVVKNYEEALKLGPARRAQAQGLDFERAGEELFPSFQKAEEELSKGVSETMDTLTTEAKEAYRFLGVRPEDVSPELRNEIASFNDAINTKRTNLETAQKSPARYKEVKALGQELKDLETRRLTLLNKAKQEISARSQQYIESGKEWFNKISQIKDDLRALQDKRGIEKLSQPEQAMQEGLSYVELGGGPKEYGFSNKNYTDPSLDDAERFSRLWKMRQILDDNINWVKYEKGGNLGDDERFLIKARGAIKDELRKYSTAFENSDRIYSMFSDIKEKVFGKGKKPVDRFTLGRMLTDTDTAKRYGEYVKDLRSLAADPLISATRRSEIQNFLDQFDKLKLLAKDKASIAAWEKSFGPTGQGTQKAVADAKRLVSAVGESSTIGKLFGDPNKFMKVDQNFAPKIEFITGKPGIKELATDELLAITRTNNKYQKAMFNKESVTDDSLKAFYEAELSKIRSKPTPPEGPKGGGESPPSSGGQGGASFQQKTADRIKDGIRSYALNRLTTAAANQAAKAAGSEQGINVFEPYKDDLKSYLVSEYGIPERLADMAVGVLPNNPIELMNTVRRIPKAGMGDVIKFPGSKKDIGSTTKEPTVKSNLGKISKETMAENNARAMKEAGLTKSKDNQTQDLMSSGNEKGLKVAKNEEPISENVGINSTYERLNEYLAENKKDKSTARWLKNAKTEIQDEPYIGRDFHNLIAFQNQDKINNQPLQPIPVDLKNIGDLKGTLGKGVLSGQSDPFNWIDSRYGITKELLQREKNKPLEIYTRSDLIANDDYIEALDKGKHIVNIVIPGTNNGINRIIEPGAPSLKRRINAANKLAESGLNVNIIYQQVTNKNLPDSFYEIAQPDSVSVLRQLREQGLNKNVNFKTISQSISDEAANSIKKVTGIKDE
jgi:hypothetical protein